MSFPHAECHLGYRMQPILDLATQRPVAHELLCGQTHCPTANAQYWSGWYASVERILSQERSPLPVFINLDTSQAASSDVVKIVQTWTRHHHCVLEWTEHIATHPRAYEAAATQFASWRAQGVSIAVDDVGSDFGYDGIGRVLRVQPRYAKIDMGVLWRSREPGGMEMLRHMKALLQGLGCQVIAEGIETEDDRVRCLAADIPLGQGFLFADPS